MFTIAQKWVLTAGSCLLLAFILLGIWQHETLNKLTSKAHATSALILQLESEIGYGGLIHNFKNALLRPDQPEYIERTRQNASNALESISEIEAQTLDLKDGVSFKNTKVMILHYNEALNDIIALRNNGYSTTEIDDRVYFDDTQALTEISLIHQRLLQSITDDINQTDLNMLAFEITGLVLGIIALISIYLNRAKLLERERMERLKTAKHNKALKSLNDNLTNSNRALEQFARIASHDLQAPGRQISMLAAIIIDEDNGSPKTNDYALEIKNCAERMISLVKTLFSYSQSTYQEIQPRHVNMRSIVNNVIDSMAQLADPKPDINLLHLPDVTADPALMERVWSNLLSNAIKYCPNRRPEIVIEGWTSEEDSFAYYAIADNGIGIHEDYKHIIFEPLKRLHDDSQYSGFGVGLSLVQSIISSHHGYIWLDTDHTNGARFIFKIPATLNQNKLDLFNN